MICLEQVDTFHKLSVVGGRNIDPSLTEIRASAIDKGRSLKRRSVDNEEVAHAGVEDGLHGRAVRVMETGRDLGHVATIVPVTDRDTANLLGYLETDRGSRRHTR